MTKELFGIGIIGCGLIGQKRAKFSGSRGKIIACADIELKKASSLASNENAQYFEDWKEILKLPEVDIIVVATLHESLAEISLAALEAKKHVFVEKPAARFSSELEPVINAAKKNDLKVHVGFNHRYHRSLIKAREIIDSGELGELMFIRGRYGHGGRPGYNKEWRADPELSGGGELLDQGSHLIDLSRWFLGEFEEIHGFAHTYFWDMPVDDNGFVLLKTVQKKAAFLQVSCSEWKNLFSLEIYGINGKLDLSGLGGSYGIEKISFYKMLPEMGPPETTSWEFPMVDNSWEVEMEEFYKDIMHNRNPNPGLKDAYETLKIIEKIYLESGYDYCS